MQSCSCCQHIRRILGFDVKFAAGALINKNRLLVFRPGRQPFRAVFEVAQPYYAHIPGYALLCLRHNNILSCKMQAFSPVFARLFCLMTVP